ncbi:MAG: D-glycerate dehydrogenase, partial [Myxococcales bacterium]|nr:D-glycerate dehydrogenase [Myxococcales bacterium]
MGAGERPRVVVSRALPPGWLGDLAARCELTIGGPEPGFEARLLDALADADGLLCLLTERVDAALLDRA